jgi:hypothetical protein
LPLTPAPRPIPFLSVVRMKKERREGVRRESG